MRSRGFLGVSALAVLGLVVVAAQPAAAVTFGAAAFTPVTGPAFTAAGLTGLAPVAGAPALTLTRAADATSAKLDLAHSGGTHFKTVSIAWSTSAGLQTACFGDVAVSSHSSRPVLGGRVTAIEHSTLFFATEARAPGAAACSRLPPSGPVVVRLFTDTGGLNARVDCMIATCAGGLRLLCPTLGCPKAGLPVGPVALTAGHERIFRVRVAHTVRGTHPKLTALVTLTGRPAPILLPVVVDPPPPPAVPILAASTFSLSPDLTPAAGGGPTTSTGPPGTSPSSGPPGTAPTAGAPAAPGAAPGTPGAPDTGPVLGNPGGGAPPTGRNSTLTLTCLGPAAAPTSVHGVLNPALTGKPIEIDYVPVDPAADTVIHNVVTGPGGGFTDSPGKAFLSAIAFYPGDDTYAASDGYCPSS